MAKTLGKEDKTTKAAQADADQRRQEIGGNVTREIFLQSVRELADINAKADAIRSTQRAVRKTIKARGIELGILDATLKMAEWDREEVRLAFDNRRKYADFLGLPVGTQPDMFKDMSEDEKQAVEWEAKGATDFFAAKSGSPPEECPEPFHKHYVRGFKKAAGEVMPTDAKGKTKGPLINKDGQIVKPPRTAAEEKEFDNAGKTPAPLQVVGGTAGADVVE